MSKTLEILLAEPAVANYGGNAISISEIPWPDLLTLAEEIAKVASGHIRQGADGKVSIAIDLTAIGDLIRGSRELGQKILVAATNLPAADIAKLPARVAMRLLDVAIEQNFTPEFLEAGKGLAARLTAALGGAETLAASSKA
jgi:hypothetical protein